MSYYIEDKNIIVFADDDKNRFENTINKFIPQYLGWEIKETERKIIMLEGKYVYEDEVQEELAKKRKEEFESQFLTTSKGNYRLKPNGYANAQQSIDVIDSLVLKLGALTEQIAQMIIFYETPDFYSEEQCKEEWLIAHQYNPKPMTKEEWAVFYVEFAELYAQKEYT